MYRENRRLTLHIELLNEFSLSFRFWASTASTTDALRYAFTHHVMHLNAFKRVPIIRVTWFESNIISVALECLNDLQIEFQG